MEKRRTTLELPRDVARWVPPRPWLGVHSAVQPRLRVGKVVVPLELVRLPALSAEQLNDWAQSVRPKGHPLIVYVPVLSRESRDLLEARNIGFVDSRGHVHLVWESGIIHVEPAPGQRALAPSAQGLGASGVRLVQLLLETSEAESITDLSKRAGLSLSQTHKVLVLLEKEGLVGATGKGPARRRTVLDRTKLLDWLEKQRAARRRDRHLDVAMYVRKPAELWPELSRALGKAHIEHGITGAAGAALYGAGPTNVLLTRVRINPEVALEEAARALGAQVVDAGANVRLVRDTGQVGSRKTLDKGGARVADQVRVYLDAQSERRGEDVAQHFREVCLGY
jgi:hypothetical protein